MGWRESLIRIANYEVETLQKRLGEIVQRKSAAEMRLIMLDAEAEAEAQAARADPEIAYLWVMFRQGLKARRAAMEQDLAAIEHEEAGARDALGEAFETLKKYEHVAESARLADLKEAARRETIAMDELGLRRAST
jgi:flagellar export protein FliJ